MVGALAGVAALLGLVLGLLAVPVAVAFRCQRTGTLRGQVRVRWLFGLVRLRIGWPTAHAGRAASDTRGSARAREARTGRGKRRGHVRVLRLLRDAALRRRVVRLARDVFAALHLRQLSLRARLGLGDPADTGRLWALLGPVHAAAQGRAGIELQIEPAFQDAVFEFDARGRCLLVPLQFLALAAAFVFSPATIRAWQTARSADG